MKPDKSTDLGLGIASKISLNKSASVTVANIVSSILFLALLLLLFYPEWDRSVSVLGRVQSIAQPQPIMTGDFDNYYLQSIEVEEGDEVKKGRVLARLEERKNNLNNFEGKADAVIRENRPVVTAPRDGIVLKILAQPGISVNSNTQLLLLQPNSNFFEAIFIAPVSTFKNVSTGQKVKLLMGQKNHENIYDGYVRKRWIDTSPDQRIISDIPSEQKIKVIVTIPLHVNEKPSEVAGQLAALIIKSEKINLYRMIFQK